MSDSSPASAIKDLQPHFPDFEFLEVLGAGGMGTVYKAYDPRLDRFVALKVLASDLDDSLGFVERFQLEAQSLALVQHPNIVPCYDYRVTGDGPGAIPYLVMAFVEGQTLEDAMRDNALTLARSLELVGQVAAGLESAHVSGIVHRDIKPANILIDLEGKALLTDFGIAKILDPEPGMTGLTLTGVGMGTLAYAAPEQLESSAAVDQRADIYSLGAVLYHLLTGSPPQGVFKSLTETQPGLDKRFDPIIRKALATDPADRYPDIPAFTADLARVKIAPPAPSSIRSRRGLRLAAIVCTLIAFASTAFFFLKPDPPTLPTLSAPPQLPLLSPGRLRGSGTINGRPIDLSKASGLTDIITARINVHGEWIALRANGSTISNQPNVQGLPEAIAISAGWGGLLAISESGFIQCSGIFIAPIPRKFSPIALAATGSLATVVTTKGEIHTWGQGRQTWEKSSDVDTWTLDALEKGDASVVQVAARGRKTILLCADGSVATRSDAGIRPGPSRQHRRFTSVACTPIHFAGLQDDGTVLVWKENFPDEAEIPTAFQNQKFVTLCSTLSLIAARTVEGSWRCFTPPHEGHLPVDDLITKVEALENVTDLSIASRSQTWAEHALLWVEPVAQP